MAITALHSAATGLSALSTDIDVIANNLANVNTNGFKTLRSNFEDLLYQQKAQPGVENGNGEARPAGIFVGLGTRISNTQLNLTTGPAVPDDSQTSLMIDGPGFFQVATAENIGGGTAYTRAGNFFVNRDGNLVLGNADGPQLDPPITIPNGTREISIDQLGNVSVLLDTDAQQQQVGQIELANFVNPTGIKPIGKNLYVETDASGPAFQGPPGEGTFGTIIQFALEGSNVDPVKELINLIKTQRAFEMNSQSIQAADEALQVVSNLRGR